MTNTISAVPGQTVLIAVQVTDNTGKLHDGYEAPTIDFVRLPSGAAATGYPVVMTEYSLGIWTKSLVMPSGITALGSYLVSVSWPHPDTAVFQNELFLINVALPFGNSSVSPG